MTAKPTVADLGIDPNAQRWQRSGAGEGSIEVAFPAGGQWVLVRVAGDRYERVLVFDRHEWECFLDGARKGEFDDAAEFDDAGLEIGINDPLAPIEGVKVASTPRELISGARA